MKVPHFQNNYNRIPKHFFLIRIHYMQDMELQEKKHKKDYRIQKICLERTYN